MSFIVSHAFSGHSICTCRKKNLMRKHLYNPPLPSTGLVQSIFNNLRSVVTGLKRKTALPVNRIFRRLVERKLMAEAQDLSNNR